VSTSNFQPVHAAHERLKLAARVALELKPDRARHLEGRGDPVELIHEARGDLTDRGEPLALEQLRRERAVLPERLVVALPIHDGREQVLRVPGFPNEARDLARVDGVDDVIKVRVRGHEHAHRVRVLALHLGEEAVARHLGHHLIADDDGDLLLLEAAEAPPSHSAPPGHRSDS
jgi:hypothetical protein